MRHLVDRIRYGGAPKTPEEADRLALRQLEGRGADLSRPRHIIHYLYFPTERQAHGAVEAIGDVWKTVIEQPTETASHWCVKADGTRTIGPEIVSGFRAWFVKVAQENGGEYDGWEASAKP